MVVYPLSDSAALSFARYRGGQAVTGLAPVVTVTNLKTGAVLLSSTPVPEVPAGSGSYVYNWAHGLTTNTECLVTYTVGGFKYPERILITADVGGHAV